MSISQSQIYAGIGYAATIGGTLATAVGAICLLDPSTTAAIVQQIQLVANDLQQLVGDTWKLALLCGPAAVYISTHIGIKSASAKSQIASVQALPQAQVTVTDPKLAAGIPGVKVAPLPA